MLLKLIGDKVENIKHIGSTSVKGLGAKPIIDILIGVGTLELADQCVEKLVKNGYEYVKKHEVMFPKRRYFTKGSRKKGRSHHIHMVETQSPFYKNHILFRNYLRSNPSASDEYYILKKRLEKKYRNDREEYTDSKTKFIEKILEKARNKI